MSTETDGDIIRRARDNPALFGELYDRHAAVLYRYAVRRAGEFAADDVIADAFLVAWERLESYDLTSRVFRQSIRMDRESITE